MITNCSASVVTVEEQRVIIDWADLHYDDFKENGYSRRYYVLQITDDTIPEEVWEIKRRVVETESLYGYSAEPIFGDFIGYVKDGGQIQPHVDSNQYDEVTGELLIHTRFNVFIQLPVSGCGGRPIYGGRTIDVCELQYVKCLSGVERHYCEKVRGDVGRIVLSFGFLIPLVSP